VANIVITGFMATGKSTVGRRVAHRLGRPFVDTDVEVHARTGRSPDAMIRAGDEPEFRAAEAAALEDVLARSGVVVATGGGAALHVGVLDGIGPRCFIVLLDADDDVLLARWAAAPRAPLTDLPPRQELARQRAERSRVYERVAGLVVDTSRLSLDETAEAVADALDATQFLPASSARPPRIDG
jgi:shikimate kinase